MSPADLVRALREAARRPTPTGGTAKRKPSDRFVLEHLKHSCGAKWARLQMLKLPPVV